MFKIPDEKVEPRPGHFISLEQMNLFISIRSIFTNFAIWEYAYAIALAENSSRADSIFERLLSVPTEVNRFFAQYYGDQAADFLLELQTRSVVVYRDLLSAMLAGDSETASNRLIDLYDIAEQISRLLAGLNPYWSEAHWNNLLRRFVQSQFRTSFAIISDDHVQGIKLFEKTVGIARLIADYLARGVMANFNPIPPEFTSNV